MKRYLLLFVLSFFAMVLPVSADENNPQTITLEEFVDCSNRVPLPYIITVKGTVHVNALQDAEVIVPLKKGIYLVNFAHVARKMKIGH